MFSNCNEPMLQNQFKLGGEIKRWEVVWKQLSVTASLENMQRKIKLLKTKKKASTP